MKLIYPYNFVSLLFYFFSSYTMMMYILYMQSKNKSWWR